ncbi:hypothetical protein D7252_02130 [Microbacterium sp. CGR2]|nr:hypothetical protein D7252_02130 [Microbacterium sp. CGR2]
MRYHCSEHTPEKTEFVFDSILGSRRIEGTHTVWIDAHGPSTVLRHEIVAVLPLRLRLVWTVVVRPLHDSLLEDLLHGAQVRAGASSDAPRWSLWVRLLRRLSLDVRGVTSPEDRRPATEGSTTAIRE